MIADSSVLIIFAKINKLDLLNELYGTVHITGGIFDEIVTKGLLIDAPDSKILKEFVENKKIIVLKLHERHIALAKHLRKVYQLGIGESESLSLSLQKGEKTVLLDELKARKIFRLYGLKAIGSLRVLVEAYNKNLVKDNELRSIVDQMVKHGFRIGSDVLSEFWNIFEKIKKKK